MAATTLTISYPRTADATFDFDYFVNQHMPMVLSKGEKHGMKSWRLLKLDERAPYIYEVIAHFDNKEGIKAAWAEEGDNIKADMAKFTNTKPVRMIGEMVAKGP